MQYSPKTFSLSIFALLSAFIATSPSQAQNVPVAPQTLLTKGSINCNLSGGPFIYAINSTLTYENTLISQDPTVWFVPDHQYCLTIRTPAYCNTLRFFNGQVVNGKRIQLPAHIDVRSVVLGGIPVTDNFICR